MSRIISESEEKAMKMVARRVELLCENRDLEYLEIFERMVVNIIGKAKKRLRHSSEPIPKSSANIEREINLFACCADWIGLAPDCNLDQKLVEFLVIQLSWIARNVGEYEGIESIDVTPSSALDCSSKSIFSAWKYELEMVQGNPFKTTLAKLDIGAFTATVFLIVDLVFDKYLEHFPSSSRPRIRRATDIDRVLSENPVPKVLAECSPEIQACLRQIKLERQIGVRKKLAEFWLLSYPYSVLPETLSQAIVKDVTVLAVPVDVASAMAINGSRGVHTANVDGVLNNSTELLTKLAPKRPAGAAVPVSEEEPPKKIRSNSDGFDENIMSYSGRVGGKSNSLVVRLTLFVLSVCISCLLYYLKQQS